MTQKLQDSVAYDLRFAFRGLLRNPALAALAVATLGLAIGASAGVFSVVDATLLEPLPFDSPEELVQIQASLKGELRQASYPEIRDWMDQARSFEGVAAYAPVPLSLHGEGDPVRLNGEVVSANYFSILGMRPAKGRLFTFAEDRIPDSHQAVMISDALWRTRFGGDFQVLGSSVLLNDRPFMVIGILPVGFRGLSLDADLWITPMMVSTVRDAAILDVRSARWLFALGRMRPDVSLTSAQVEMDQIASRLAQDYPNEHGDWGIDVRPLRESYLGSTGPLLLGLLAAVGTLLLVACANVANILLVRAGARRQEVVLRLAVGARRFRLLRQFLIESLVISALGASLGLVVALWVVDGLTPFVPQGVLPGFVELDLDLWVLLFTAGTATLAGLVSGLAPALALSRGDLSPGLHDVAGAVRVPGRRREIPLHEVVVVGEVALALVLAIAAGLMIRTLHQHQAVDPGFEAEHLLVVRIDAPERRYPSGQLIRLSWDLEQRLADVRGFDEVGLASSLPFRERGEVGTVWLEDRVEINPGGYRYARHQVSPGLFRTMAIPVEQGRGLTDRDGRDSPSVAVISSAMAARFWPDDGAVGKKIGFEGPEGPWVSIVGVVGDVRFRDLSLDPARLSDPDVYRPLAQSPARALDIVIRTSMASEMAVERLRKEITLLDGTMPIYAVAWMEDELLRETGPDRFGAFLMGLFSTLAASLAAIGMYGIVAFAVSRRRLEMAIRLTLGAGRRDVVERIVGGGLRLAGGGVLIGLAMAFIGTQILRAFVRDTSGADPVTFGSAALGMVLVSFVASYLPARRAAAVDPRVSLETD